MCDVTVLAIASLAATAATTAVSFIGAQQQAQANKEIAAYQQAVAANNAEILRQEAIRAEQEATVAAQQRDFEGKRLVGNIIASLAANGVSVDAFLSTQGLLAGEQSSAGALVEEARAFGALDVATTLNAGEVAAHRLRLEALNVLQGGQLASAESLALASAARTQGFTSLLTGASRIGSNVINFGQAGVPGFPGSGKPFPSFV